MTDRDSRDEARAGFEGFLFDDAMSGSEAAFDADLSAVHADDALLDALGGSDPKVADGLGDQELNALLLAWRRDIDSEPLAELVDTDTAVTTVKTAALARRRGDRAHRRRLVVPAAAAAAVLAIAFTVTGLAARDAQPGDTLWGLAKVLYSDHTRSVEAAATARQDLDRARTALFEGRLAEARLALNEALAKLTEVSSEDNLDLLKAQHDQLSALLENPGAKLPPSSVPPILPTSGGLPPPQPSSPSESATNNPGLPATLEPSSSPEPTSSSSSPSTSSSTEPPGASNGTSGEGTVRYDTSNTGAAAETTPGN